VIGIATTGNMNASYFVPEFETLNRRHMAGEFGDALVIFAYERVPLGPLLWQEIKAGSQLRIPTHPWIYWGMPSNRYVERLNLVSRSFSHYILPDVSPPSRGLALPSRVRNGAIPELSVNSFVLMQISRREMFFSLQEAGGRVLSKSDTQALKYLDFQVPETSKYPEDRMLLRSRGCTVVDLWEAIGDPARLFSVGTDSEIRRRDELQAWLYANCEIFVSAASGAWWIAWALGRPTLVVDSYYLNRGRPITMTLPVLLWDSLEKRLVRISEIGEKNFALFAVDSPERYEKIANSVEEISEAVLELRAITRGEAEVDQELQARVVDLLHTHISPGRGKPPKPTPILAQGFLRRHPEILA